MYPAALTSTFEPAELAFLKRVFDDVCLEHGLTDGSNAASDVAAQMIQLYQGGIKDEGSLHRHFDGHDFFG
ncbi:hypothetical protein [Neorhizobium sp. NCHU2750]|uniref:hypothetical protein n=1 Tax=Neorhizobium sp. NCHU2750 TaxID=1825976 RepID=UPI000E72E592|nr:hypothetical protein NCHU2750_30590 [Neorhizobium sp. NCHU2750]